MFEVPATARSSADTPCCWAVVGVFWCKGQSDFIWDRSGLYYLDCQCRKLAGALKKTKQGLSFERGFLCPAGTEAYFYLLFGPPPAGARRGRLWGCAPFSAPLASPPKHPAGAFQHPTFCEGCAAFAAGASSLRSVISLRAAQCQRSPSRWMRGRGRRVGCMESQIE